MLGASMSVIGSSTVKYFFLIFYSSLMFLFLKINNGNFKYSV